MSNLTIPYRRFWRSSAGIAVRAIQARKSRKPILLAVGFSLWKEGFIRRFFKDFAVIFVDDGPNIRHLRESLGAALERVAIWSFKDEALGLSQADLAGLTVARVEDGFIRSIGRGVDLTAPWSLCVDETGMYFDSSRVCDLEVMCNSLSSDEVAPLLVEVKKTIEEIRRRGICKYNLGDGGLMPNEDCASATALVLGQVEDDESIRRNPGFKTNRALLEYALAENSGAQIFFKQHPDCVGRNPRPGYLDVSGYSGVGAVDPAVPITQAISSARTVYTISSLGGFEALIRGREVVTLGAPFYAGWGLTKDYLNFPRRRRKLSLEELFYVAYMKYPKYFDPFTGDRLSLSDVIDRLSFRGS